MYRFNNTSTQDEIKPSYKREISISHDLRHENIHRLIGLYWGEGETLPGFVSAWCPMGDIIGFLGRKEPSIALERTRLELLSQTLQGLVHLHHENDPPVIHGDIKPANILISDRGTALICDFGHARIYTETRTIDPAAVSTVRYMAPELHSEEHESSFTTKTDIWAFGTSAAQIMFQGNRLPYATAFNDSTVYLLSVVDLPFCSVGIPDRFWWWLLATWELAPDERPTAKQLLSEIRPFHGILAQNAKSWRGDTLPNLQSTDQFFTLHSAQRVLGATRDYKKQKSVKLRELYGLFDNTKWQSNAMLQALYVVLTSSGGKQWLATCCDQNGKSQDSKQRATEITQRLLDLCVDGWANPERCNARLFRHVARATVEFMVDERRKYANWEPPLNAKSTLDPLFGFLDKEKGCERLATKARKFFGAPLQIPALDGHTGTVRCMQFTSDGRRLVSGSDDHTLMIWDCTTGQPVLPQLKGHRSHVTCLALSRDDSRIVSGGKDRHVIIWNAGTGAATCKPLGRHTDTVTCVAFARDGHRIASADARLICIWTVMDTHLLATTDLAETPAPAPVSLSFTVGGALAWLGGADRVLHTLCAGGELSTQVLVAPKRQRSAAVHAAVLAADGATAALAFADHTAALVDVSARGGGALAQAHHTVPTGPPATHAKVEKPRHRPKKSGRPQRVPAAPAASEEPPAPPLLALAPGGHQALSSWNGTLLVLDPADECDDAQQEFEKDRPHSAIALSPEGYSAATARSGGGEYCIRIWSFGGNPTSSLAGGRAGTDPEDESNVVSLADSVR